MEKNKIFLGVIGGALLLAAIANVFSSEEDYDNDHHLEVIFGDDDKQHGLHSRSGRNGTVEFNGKTVRCDAETGTVELKHEDGSVTTVTCD